MSSADLHIGEGGNIRRTFTQCRVAHIGHEGVCRHIAGHDIAGSRPAGSDTADHIIGNIAALGHGGTERHAANAAAACASSAFVCAVIEAAVDDTGQTALQEGVAVTAAAAATGTSSSACIAASTAASNTTGGGDAPCGQHYLCQHGAACMAHIDAQALHEAVDLL